jgi:hypothetical protein
MTLKTYSPSNDKEGDATMELNPIGRYVDLVELRVFLNSPGLLSEKLAHILEKGDRL